MAAIINTDLPVSNGALTRGAPMDSIPAVTQPAFGQDWSSTLWTLEPDEPVVGVVKGRAYPVAVFN